MYKSQLNELCQKKGWEVPVYSCIKHGEDHRPDYRASVVVNGITFVSPSFFNSLKPAYNDVAGVALSHFTTISQKNTEMLVKPLEVPPSKPTCSDSDHDKLTPPSKPTCSDSDRDKLKNEVFSAVTDCVNILADDKEKLQNFASQVQALRNQIVVECLKGKRLVSAMAEGSNPKRKCRGGHE